MVYSRATEHVDLIRKLRNPSIVAVVSVSESLLRVGAKHSGTCNRTKTYIQRSLGHAERADEPRLEKPFGLL